MVDCKDKGLSAYSSSSSAPQTSDAGPHGEPTSKLPGFDAMIDQAAHIALKGTDTYATMQALLAGARRLVRTAETVILGAQSSEAINGASALEPGERSAFAFAFDQDDTCHTSADALRAKRMYKARRLRDVIFSDPDLFGEAGWDLLLEAYDLDAAGKQMSVKHACASSSVPWTTALRWVNMLVKRGYLEQEADESDKRRTWVRISPMARDMMSRYFSELRLREL